MNNYGKDEGHEKLDSFVMDLVVRVYAKDYTAAHEKIHSMVWEINKSNKHTYVRMSDKQLEKE